MNRRMSPEPPPVASGPNQQTRVVLQVLLVVAGVVSGLWMLHRLAPLVLVLIVSTALAYVIAPLVKAAERPIRLAGRRRHLPRAAAIVLVYVLLAGIASGGAALLLPSATNQIDDAVARAPAYAQSILTWERGWARYYARIRMPLAVRQSVDRSLAAAGAAGAESGRSLLMSLVGTLSDLPWLLLIPILAFFLLKDAAAFRRTVVLALPHRIRLRGHRLFEELNATLAAYVRAQLLACVLVGNLCGLGFAVLGLPYPVLLGALAGVLEFIPLVGPLLLAAVALTVAALHAPVLVFWAAGFLAVLRVVQDYVIYPRLIRRGIQLHPFAVIVAVLTGAELDGVAGMFLAVPAVAIASVVYRHWLDWRSGDVPDVPADPPTVDRPLALDF